MRENTDFHIENGVLWEYYGNAETVTVPDGVREIKNLAFACCYALETVAVRRGTKIAENAFEHSPNAKVITR